MECLLTICGEKNKKRTLVFEWSGPFLIRLQRGHLKYDLQKVRISNGFRMVGYQIPTVCVFFPLFSFWWKKMWNCRERLFQPENGLQCKIPVCWSKYTTLILEILQCFNDTQPSQNKFAPQENIKPNLSITIKRMQLWMAGWNVKF